MKAHLDAHALAIFNQEIENFTASAAHLRELAQTGSNDWIAMFPDNQFCINEAGGVCGVEFAQGWQDKLSVPQYRNGYGVQTRPIRRRTACILSAEATEKVLAMLIERRDALAAGPMPIDADDPENSDHHSSPHAHLDY